MHALGDHFAWWPLNRGEKKMLRAANSATLRRRLAMGEEVIEALYGRNKKPIVALESTIISHGMPYPQNLEMVKTVEDIVRAQGACPATICIANGELKVGLSDKDLKMLAEMGSAARKCSTRDIPAAIAQRFVGATTVSSTMYVAQKLDAWGIGKALIACGYTGVSRTPRVSACL
jgi:pseudouridylate synthase